jgi:hypothetical protein
MAAPFLLSGQFCGRAWRQTIPALLFDAQISTNSFPYEEATGLQNGSEWQASNLQEVAGAGFAKRW